MKRNVFVLFLLPLFLAAAGSGKEPGAKFKSIEVTHFSQEEGVELPPEFPDFLYAELVERLENLDLFVKIVGENEVVDPSEAESSLILQGTILEYGKGSVAKTWLIGAGVGRRSLRVQVTLRRRSDEEIVLDKEMKVRSPKGRGEKVLAKVVAKKIAKEVRKLLRR